MRKPFDLLREVSRFGVERGISLADARMSDAFGHHVDAAMSQALSDPILLQGMRVEAMFENLVASLGEVMLIKPEDTGPFQSAEPMLAPDFRVVLKDGANWLVEVKNVYCQDPAIQRRELMTKDYRRKLETYARATGAILKIAVFWARWSIWTLVDPERMAPRKQGLTLDMLSSIKANEMGALGDQTIGLRAPLSLRLTMDPPRTSEIDGDGNVIATISKAQMFSAGHELLHPSDQRIAWAILQYAGWEMPPAHAVTCGQRLEAIEFTCSPREPSDQGFELAGSLSRMFSRFYAERTISDGKVIDIAVPLQNEWLGALCSRDGPARMALWRFIQKPRYDHARASQRAPGGPQLPGLPRL